MVVKKANARSKQAWVRIAVWLLAAAGPWVNSCVLACWVQQLLQLCLRFLFSRKPSAWTHLEEALGLTRGSANWADMV